MTANTAQSVIFTHAAKLNSTAHTTMFPTWYPADKDRLQSFTKCFLSWEITIHQCLLSILNGP